MRINLNYFDDLSVLGSGENEVFDAVYLHEYIHFIQDVSTTFGYSNISITADYMRFVNNTVIASKKAVFSVPLLPPKKDPFNVYDNLKLKKYYNGDEAKGELKFNGYRVIPLFLDDLNNPVPLNIIELNCTTSDGRLKKFEFGGICIMESMAYIIQTECYPDILRQSDFLYVGAEIVAKAIYPKFASNRLNVLALCDASLGVYNPGFFFCSLLESMKRDNVSFTDPVQIYLYSHCNISDRSNKPIDLRDLHSSAASQSKDQLVRYFNDNYFLDVKFWLSNMIESAFAYRRDNPDFIIKIARGGKLISNQALRNFVNQIGSPLITNANYQTKLSMPVENPHVVKSDYVWCLDQISKIYWGKRTSCELKTVCQKKGIKVDTRCDLEPWERSKDPINERCTFGDVWWHWGMKNHVPKLTR
ncbi:hypothetical protein [Chitinophaga niastensis]|nr:hypothetical protein [Chitinophaga niastensis]